MVDCGSDLLRNKLLSHACNGAVAHALRQHVSVQCAFDTGRSGTRRCESSRVATTDWDKQPVQLLKVKVKVEHIFRVN